MMKVEIGRNTATGQPEFWRPSHETTHLAIIGRPEQGTRKMATRIGETIAAAGITVDYLITGPGTAAPDSVRQITPAEWHDYFYGLQLLHADRLSAAMTPPGVLAPWKPIVILLDGFSDLIDAMACALNIPALQILSLIRRSTGLGIHFILRDDTLTTHWYTEEIAGMSLTKVSAPMPTSTSTQFWGVDTSTPPQPDAYFIGQTHTAPRSFSPTRTPRLVPAPPFADAA